MYTLKINCKGKRTVGKAVKRINVEKYNRFLKIKNYNYKKEKKKKGGTPQNCKNVEAEVYNNNKKCDWEQNEKSSKV